MENETPQEPSRNRVRRRRVRPAAWCTGGGSLLALAATVGAVRGSLSPAQAIAIGVPAAVLLVSGAAVLVLPDVETARRRGAGTGFLIGSLLARCRPGGNQHNDSPQTDDSPQPDNRPLG